LASERQKTSGTLPLIVGVGVGGVAAAADIALVIVVLVRRRRKCVFVKRHQRGQGDNL